MIVVPPDSGVTSRPLTATVPRAVSPEKQPVRCALPRVIRVAQSATGAPLIAGIPPACGVLPGGGGATAGGGSSSAIVAVPAARLTTALRRRG